MVYQLQPATRADTYGWDIALSNAPSLGSVPGIAVQALCPSENLHAGQGHVIVDGVDGATLVVLNDIGEYVAQWHLPCTCRKVAQHMARQLLLHAGKGGSVGPAYLQAHGWRDSL